MNGEIGVSFRACIEPDRIRAIAAAVSGFDFDTLGVWDDLGDPTPWPLLRALAMHPGEARIGPECLALPKYASLDGIMGELAHLAQLRPGRVFLGLTGGAWMDRIGLARAGTRHMREAIEVVRSLSKGAVSAYAGRHYRLSADLRLNFTVPERLPILVGAWGERMSALAGELADELKVGGSANPAMVTIARERAHIGAMKAGRPTNEPKIVLGAVTVVAEDSRTAMRAARLKAAPYIAVIGGNDPSVVRDFPEELAAIQSFVAAHDLESAAKALPDALLRRFAFCGSPAEVTRQAGGILDAGAERVEFGSPHGLDELHGLELIGRHVLPNFRPH